MVGELSFSDGTFWNYLVVVVLIFIFISWLLFKSFIRRKQKQYQIINKVIKYSDGSEVVTSCHATINGRNSKDYNTKEKCHAVGKLMAEGIVPA